VEFNVANALGGTKVGAGDNNICFFIEEVFVTSISDGGEST